MIPLDLPRLRAAWAAHQGLLGPRARTVAATTALGWPRTLGGADSYLPYSARLAGFRREDLDSAAARGEVRVVPAVRGCIFLVPAADAGVCVRFAASLARKRTLRDLEKAGAAPDEAARVGAAALDVLADGPRGTDALRKALPAALLRPLGDAGKKVGISSVLPTALRILEFDGRIRRVPTGGLEAERYDWHVVTDPFAGAPDEDDAVGLAAAMLRLFLAQAGPATLDEFVAWSTAGKRDAKAALERVAPVAVRVEGWGEGWALPEHAAALADVRPADPDVVALISGYDPYVQLRASMAPLADAAHHNRPMPEWSGRAHRLADANSAETRLVVIGGAIAGVWDWDVDAREVVWATWAPGPRETIAREAERVAALFGELGHGRIFSLDTDAGARKRGAWVRGQQG